MPASLRELYPGKVVRSGECRLEVVENYERIGADEIMPIFQAGPATHQAVLNSLRLFGKYVIPHFMEKKRRDQAAAAAAADNG